MNANQPPAAPPSQPTVVQQTTVIQVGGQKSVGLAILLAFLFGPLGMLYATVPGAIVIFVLDVLIAIPTAGGGLVLTWLIGMIWAGASASSHNKGLGVAAQSVVTPAPQSPAAWHSDPDGSGRLRYWDGQGWTEHYAENPSDAGEQEPAQLAAASPGPGDVVACGSCGEQIATEHRFCPSCGAARPATP